MSTAYLTKSHARMIYIELTRGIAKIVGVKLDDLPHDVTSYANDPSVMQLPLELDSPAGRITLHVYGGDRESGYKYAYDPGWTHVRFHEPMHALLVLKAYSPFPSMLNVNSGKWNWHPPRYTKMKSLQYRDRLRAAYVVPFLKDLAAFQPRLRVAEPVQEAA